MWKKIAVNSDIFDFLKECPVFFSKIKFCIVQNDTLGAPFIICHIFASNVSTH